eukprot:gene13313-9540_t
MTSQDSSNPSRTRTELFDILGIPKDHIRLQVAAETFGRSIEVDHLGFGIIFKETIEPRIRKIPITAAEEHIWAANPNSLQALGIKKKIEAQALEELNFELQKELVARFEQEVQYLSDSKIMISLLCLDLLPDPGDDPSYTEATEAFLMDHIVATDTTLVARELLQRLNQSAYDELLSHLANEYAAGRDNYPSTIEAAFNVAYQFKPRQLRPAKQERHPGETPDDWVEKSFLLRGNVLSAENKKRGWEYCSKETFTPTVLGHSLARLYPAQWIQPGATDEFD